MADVTGYPEGASMTFDIYDISGDPPMVVDRSRGKNEKGVVKGEWVVKDKTGKDTELEIAFEAIVRSKATEKCIVSIKNLTIIDVYFEDDNGNVISRLQPNRKVNLIIKTTDGTGKIIDVDLTDITVDFKYNGLVLKNDILTDLKVVDDNMKIELHTVKGR